MKKAYITPNVTFENYELTSQIAGYCTEHGMDSVLGKDPVEVDGVECWVIDKKTGVFVEEKGCTGQGHDFSFSPSLQIFADVNGVEKCRDDVYSKSELLAKLQNAFTGHYSGDGIPKYTSNNIPYFSLKGSSPEHCGTFEGLPFNTAFYS